MKKAAVCATNSDESPVWIYRPVVNVLDLYRWGEQAGIPKMMPPETLHSTIATVRHPVAWRDLALQDDEIVIPAGYKKIEIFAYTVKALAYGDPRIKARHEELLARFPAMDHPLLRPHVSLYKGGRMPKIGYEGEIVLGPERAEVFDASNAMGIKHIRIADHI